jgi:hypothetical protein
VLVVAYTARDVIFEIEIVYVSFCASKDWPGLIKKSKRPMVRTSGGKFNSCLDQGFDGSSICIVYRVEMGAKRLFSRRAHYVTRSRIRAYEEFPQSSSAVRGDVCPNGKSAPLRKI